jgi:alkanesulfonate monooxygenase SsuD/methylene tetrahydromethanopterin reductase-like flavin-dependent oxidoreductase (luciferase family)
MQFSMIFEGQLAYPTRANEQQVMRDIVDQAVLAEEMGFDRVWAVEHHCLEQFAHISAPEILLSYIAAKTSRIRIGHGVVCVPFKYNHPIRVAERLAMMDIVSGGRVDFGAGRGATPQELNAFDIDAADTQPQLVESLHMIPRIWTDDVFEWHGDLLDVPPRPVIPKPVQDPHPPMFLACTRHETLDLAGRLGVGALCLGFAGPDDIAAKRKAYDAAIATRRPDDTVGRFAVNHLSALCPAMVLDDRERARSIGFRGQRFFTEAISRWYGGGPPPDPSSYDDVGSDEVLRQRGEAVVAYLHQEKIEAGTELTGMFNPNHAYGSVDDAVAYVERLVDAGADEVMFLMQMGTVPQDAILESITNLGRKVLPQFR